VPWRLPGAAEENHENNHHSRSAGQDLILIPEHKGLLLSIVQLCLVNVYSTMHPSGLWWCSWEICGPSLRQSLAAVWGDVSLCVDCGSLFICLPLSTLLKQVHWCNCILYAQYIKWPHNRMIVSLCQFVFMFHIQKYVSKICICIRKLSWELNLICNFFVQNMVWTHER